MPAFLIDTDWIIDHFNGHAIKEGRPVSVGTHDANPFDLRSDDQDADAEEVMACLRETKAQAPRLSHPAGRLLGTGWSADPMCRIRATRRLRAAKAMDPRRFGVQQTGSSAEIRKGCGRQQAAHVLNS